jgi:hypothetical protein
VRPKREKTAWDELLKARVSKSFKALVEETAVARGQTLPRPCVGRFQSGASPQSSGIKTPGANRGVYY